MPFVDVVSSMLDDSFPLTVNEWDEWGDPRVREQFDAMLAYSPYDNPPKAGDPPRPARHRRRPRHPRARARARQVGGPAARDRPGVVRKPLGCLFRAETGTGSHVGPSGRLDHLAYEAEVAAWLLDRLGLGEVPPAR